MDKFEYNLKMEKLKRLVEKRDFTTAAQLADTIDWKHVKNSRLLSVVSMIYEKNRRYKDAKDILMICYERSAGGRRLIYKLTELSAKEQNFEDAELFYKEYEEMVPDDPGLDILRYEILTEQGAPVDEQIRVLEKYKDREFDERWSYELARLYQKAGREEDCVRLCDDIILWFSVGTYVEKAARLKACYEPLTPDQEEKVQNQEKYKAYVRQVAQECEIQAEKKIEEAQAQKEKKQEEIFQEEKMMETLIFDEEKRPELTSEAFDGAEESETVFFDETKQLQETEGQTDTGISANEDIKIVSEQPQGNAARTETVQNEIQIEERADESQADEKEELSEPWEEQDEEEKMSNQWESEIEKVISNFNRENEKNEEKQENKEESAVVPGLLYVSAPRANEGMEYAAEALKELHKIKGEKGNKVARITGSKLNVLGLGASLTKLNGADLVIVEAASLSNVTLAEILRETQKTPLKTIIVFVDTPEQIEHLDARAKNVMVEVLYQIEQEERARKEAHKIQIKPVMMPEKSLVEAKFAMAEQVAAAKVPEPELESESESGIDLVDLDSQIPDPIVRPVQPVIQPSVSKQPADLSGTWEVPSGGFAGIDTEKLKENLVSVAEDMVYQREEPVRKEAPKGVRAASKQQKQMEQAKNGELSAPTFVAKIKEYAEELDCVIEDIAGLAIYALADKYVEDGMPLTEELARQVTENAVIRADKRGLGSLFKSKYDKEGRLILKEAHFKM